MNNILVVNTGSSSLKIRMLDAGDRIVESADLPGGAEGLESLDGLLDRWPAFEVSGHRVVHGGSRFRSSVLVDAKVVDALDDLSALAPLHNPPAVSGIRAIMKLVPDRPVVACFDTTFHAGIMKEAAVYGLPWRWSEDLGVRRYGFHGLSHAYVSRRAAELLGRSVADLRTVTCHLGAGASLAAVSGGRSVDTTMGFTPLEGLIMATRSGSVDPGAVLWLQEKLGLSPAEMTEELERSSGLLGMTGISEDIRDVISAADAGEPRSQLAMAAYVHRIRCGIAAMAASMGGLDAVVFTGGVGETSHRIRSLVCQGLEFLGIKLDEDGNADPNKRDLDISQRECPIRLLRIYTREDLEIAAEVRKLLSL